MFQIVAIIICMKTIQFISSGFNISKTSAHITGSAYYRCLVPTRELTSMNIDCNIYDWFYAGPDGLISAVESNGKVLDPRDVVIFQGFYNKDLPNLISKARAAGQIIYIDIDDLMDDIDRTSPAYEGSKGNENWGRRFLPLIARSASGIITTNRFLANQLSVYNKNVIIIDNYIDIDYRWDLASSLPKTVGWIGNSSWRINDVSIIGKFSKEIIDNQWKVIHGGEGPEKFKILSGINIFEHRPMADVFSYPDLFEGVGVGLVPLAMTPFNKAKSALKGLEFGACGIPYLVSPIPAYSDLLGENSNFICRTPDEFASKLSILEDEDTRNEWGSEARRITESHSIKIGIKNWLDLL